MVEEGNTTHTYFGRIYKNVSNVSNYQNAIKIKNNHTFRKNKTKKTFLHFFLSRVYIICINK